MVGICAANGPFAPVVLITQLSLFPAALVIDHCEGTLKSFVQMTVFSGTSIGTTAFTASLCDLVPCFSFKLDKLDCPRAGPAKPIAMANSKNFFIFLG